jgi:amino acid adenylation domain-containing protein
METLQQTSNDQDSVPGGTYAFPLTFAQLRLWFVEQLDPDQTSYLSPWALRIRGRLNPEALTFSINQIVQRHEIFRTTFQVVEGEPMQMVSPSLHIPVPVVGLTQFDLSVAEQKAHELRRLEAQRPIDLSAGPLLRAQLVRFGSEDHLLLLTTHHIIFDGWSRSVLVRELGAFYESFLSGQPGKLEELPIQYADFAVWQREHLSGEHLDRQLSYWKQQLQGIPVSLELPTDRPRPPVQTYNGASLRFVLPSGLSEKVKTLSQKAGVTPYMTMLAGFQVLLARYTGQEDIVVGTPIANRNRAELEGIIGLFANTLVLRTQLTGNPTFLELLKRVKETALSAYANEEVPFEQLVQELRPDRSLSHSPLFQVLFSLRNTPNGNFRLADLKLEPFGGDAETSKYDLSLYLEEDNSDIRGKLEYNTDLFDAATIERMLEHYSVLLKSAIDQPEEQLSKLEILSSVERKQLLVDWNNTARDYRRDLCLHQLFEQQAERRGDAIAVSFTDQQITYRELNERANQLAHYLNRHGVGVGQRVGLFVERSLGMFVGLLGIQKSGAAYVPLDPAYPAERLHSTIEAAGITALVTQESLLSVQPDYLGTILCLDRDQSLLAQESTANPKSGVSPDDSVYVIFTSGSTGRPKGVELRHRGVVNLLEWMRLELNFCESDVFPALASFAFDMSVPELYLALISGGTVALAKRHMAADGEALASFLHMHKASIVHATPTTWGLLLDAGFTGRGTKRCIGAEPLPAELFARLMDAAQGTPLYNFYGPTETTVWSTFHQFKSKSEPIVIGRPLANTEIYILDHSGNPVPVGVPGEILIGGDGVAKGYLNQPELTAEKFVPNPSSTRSDARLYRTGDLGRYLADGRIEFAGRADHQVKIRGFRIELGEIETLLAKQESVRECVVIAREDVAGDKRLVAYVVPQPSALLSGTELREWIKQRLPEYMVPSAFVIMERLPLSPNGKVDRKALPAPDYESANLSSLQSENPIAELITNIWAEVLKAGEIKSSANFFDLGGHSLLATKVVARIRKALNVELPLSSIFEYPTVAGLSTHIESLMRQAHPLSEPLLVAGDSSKLAPLSFAQQRLWFLDQLEPNSPFYNVPMAIRLTGSFDTAAMEAALNEIVARHDTLRTTFQLHKGEPVQVVTPVLALPLTKIDLSHLPKYEREVEAQRIVKEEARRPFQLSVGPLFRLLLLTLNAEEHVVLINMHHAISDGWSLGVFFGELATLYEAFREGEVTPLAPLGLTYRDYATWQRAYLSSGALDQQLAYWKKQMSGAPQSIELPTDRVRPPVQTFHGAKQIVLFPQELLAGLKALSRTEGTTLFVTLLAAFNVLLSRYSGQQDLVVGTASAGRRHAETEKLIGFFVNTLALRTDLSGDPTFRDVLARVLQTTLNAYANQDVPFEKLVEELNPVRDMSRSPLFQVMLIQQNASQRSNTFTSVSMSPFAASGDTAKLDLLLNVSESDGQLRCALEYNTDLYNAETINQILDHYCSLLEVVVQDPACRISELSFLDEREQNQLVLGWNDTAIDYPKEKCVHQLIEEQAARTPDRVAAVFQERSLSYADLNERANQLAHRLQAVGVGPEVLVAVCLERSLDMLVAILGVLKAGGAYLPVDPAFPKDRQAFMLEDAHVPVMLTTSRLSAEMPSYSGLAINLDTDWDSIATYSKENPEHLSSPDNLAYVLYTSGSTGKPKGVMITHRNLVNFLESMRLEPGLNEDDTLVAVTTLSFDIAGLELWLPLYAGARVVIASREVAMDGTALAALLHSSHATLMQATPATWKLLLETGWAGEPKLVVLCGGEALSPALVDGVLPLCKSMWNMYGPTETTIWSTISRVEAGKSISLGHPIANTQILILDSHNRLVPIGVTGELCIGGDGVSRGYLNRPELTAERFIPNPYGQDSQEKLYKTGDLARRIFDGTIEYLGRVDHQVKIRGYRIELGEIEAVLARHPSVRECVVIAREDQPGNKFLAAYLIPVDPQVHLDVEELRAYVKQSLPDYMVPTGWMEMERFPLTPNGKVSRKDLPAPDQRAAKAATGQMPRTLVEIRLASIWEEVLQVPSVRVDDDFFNLGGHSLLAVQMMTRAREAFGCDLSLTLLFSAPKLRDLAQIIQAERGKHPFQTLIPIRKTGSKPPLFCVSRPNANALGFVFLTRNLPPDQPVIGLQSQMERDGSNWVYDQTEYEAKAREYIKAMREVYPHGPYLLTGYCEGAHIAFEMARQLEAMELPVAMIAILDAWPVENTVSRTKYILRGYVRELRKFRSLDAKGKYHYLTRSIFKRSKGNLANSPHDEAAAANAQQRRLTAEQIKKRYWPGPDFVPTKYSGRLALFRTKKQTAVRINDYKMGWSERAIGGVDVIPVSGTHALILREPNVIELAQKMQDYIDQALD